MASGTVGLRVQRLVTLPRAERHMPLVWRNLSEDDLMHWPGYDGAERGELRRLVEEFGALYAAFIRSGDPGPGWPRFDAAVQSVLWFGHRIEAVPHLLAGEWETCVGAGVADVRTLDHHLAGNLRAALDVPDRAFLPASCHPQGDGP